jgi:type VI secretion system secreted protein Hcp
MSRIVYVSAAGLVMLALAVPASAAQHIYCTFVGAKQGKFQGDHGLNGDATQIPVFSLMQELTVPFDPSSGRGTGKRQHSPLVITKSIDRSSPQFFTAAVTNEILKSVTCTLYRDTDRDAAASAFYKFTLTGANIVDVQDMGDGSSGNSHGADRERISFTYQKIELTDIESGTVAIDDWAQLL